MTLLLIAVGCVLAVYATAVGGLFFAGRRTAARELVMLVPNLLWLFRGLVSDRRVPKRSKALLWLGAVWISSPIDLIPDFVPFLGPLDDAVVAALILRHVVRVVGPDVVAEHWRGEPATLARLLSFLS